MTEFDDRTYATDRLRDLSEGASTAFRVLEDKGLAAMAVMKNSAELAPLAAVATELFGDTANAGLWFVMPDGTHPNQKTPLAQVLETPDAHKDVHARLSRLAAARMLRNLANSMGP